ncbi:MAG: DUF4397 domain-containing protein [Burkholderiales bacterium]
MNHSLKLALLSAVMVAACGGGDDLADRLDIADPAVRLVHASPNDPTITLQREGRALNDATDVGYKYESNYFDVPERDDIDWTVRDVGAGRVIDSRRFDAQRGNKYSFVVLATSATTNGVYAINDPYNKDLTSERTRVRVVNGAYTTTGVDVYLNAAGTDITTVAPFIAGTTFMSSQPASGDDSRRLEGGVYQVRITTAGSKTDVLFAGTISFGNNQDLLLIPVVNATTPARVKMLVVIEGASNRQISELTDTP